MTTVRADVGVIGGGPAGIAAAVAAAEAGARVILIDDAPRPGGQIWRHAGGAGAPRAALPWLERLAGSSVRVLSGTAVVDIEAHPAGVALLLEATAEARALRAECATVVLATGARELFLPFPGWTLPGVFGVGGAQALLKSGLDVRGRRVLIGGTGPLLLPVAASFVAAGANVIEVLEQVPLRRLAAFGAGLLRTPSRIVEAVRMRRAFAGVPYRTGEWVTDAAGAERVTDVSITDGTRTRTVQCEMLCVGYGLVPSVELARLAGCDIASGRVRVDGEQRTTVARVFAAGEPTGIGGVDAALIEGQIAGAVAALGATSGSVPGALLRSREAAARFARSLDRTFAPRAELLELARPDTIVCRCEDVRYGRIAACGSAREAKLVTRAGMGACQGRVCGAAMQQLFGWDAHTVRTPVVPARIETMMAMTDTAQRAPGETDAED